MEPHNTNWEWFRTTLYSIGDGVITTDSQGCVLQMNPVAEALTGWRETEAAGRPVGDIFRIINEKDRQAVESPVDRVLREGVVVGLANHTVLVARDGTERPVADSGAPIREGGRITGTVLIFRDQSKERRAQAALAESELRHRLLVETMAEGLALHEMIYGPDGRAVDYRIVEANAAFQRQTGIAPESIRGKLASQIYGTGTPPYLEIYGRVAATGETASFETFFEPLNKVFSISVYSPQQGWFATVFTDITERHRAEERLRENEKRFRQLFDQAPIPYQSLDEAGRFIEVNEAWLKTLGYAREGVIGKWFGDFITAECRERFRERFPMFKARGEVHGAEFVMVRQDGSTLLASFDGKIGRNADGSFRQTHCIFEDITERRAVEQALREATQRLQLATASAGLATWDWDIEKNELLWDERMFRLYGLEPDPRPQEFNTWRSRIHPDDLERALAESRAALRGEKDYDTEFRVVHPDGTVKVIKAYAVVIRNKEGQAIRQIGLNRDITEHAMLEAQLRQAQKMESVGRLAGGVAHDFNNMLQVILGRTELLMARLSPNDRLLEDLKEIQQAAEHSKNLTRQLLAFARKQTATPQVVDLNELVAGMRNMLRRLIGENMELVWAPGDKLWKVRVDPSQVDQILANLVVNARDALSDGGTIRIETKNHANNGEHSPSQAEQTHGEFVCLSVSDTGTGMDAETREHLFEPFFTTKEPGKGTGLGLATVYGIVTQNKGFIDVQSEPGRGTTLRIYLPRHVPDHGQGAGAEAEVRMGAPAPQGTETVLMVEDEEMILNLGKSVLERHGYRVLAAGKGEEALALAERHTERIDLLITDVVMPGMNGKDLRDRLAALRPGIRCLFISGYTADIIAQSGVLEEGVHYLQKPFSVAMLTRKVREALGENGD